MGGGELIWKSLCGHEGAVRSVAVSSDGQRVVSCSDDKTIRIWSVRSGKEVMDPLCGHDEVVTSVAVNRNNQYAVSGSRDGTVRLRGMSHGKQVREPLCGHEGSVHSVAVSDDCRVIASASYDNIIRVWNVSKEEVVETVFPGHTAAVACVALNEDGSRVVSGSLDGMVRAWNALNAKHEASAVKKNEVRKASALFVSVDRKTVVAGDNDACISIWDVEAGRMKEIGLPGQSSEIRSIAACILELYSACMECIDWKASRRCSACPWGLDESCCD